MNKVDWSALAPIITIMAVFVFIAFAIFISNREQDECIRNKVDWSAIAPFIAVMTAFVLIAFAIFISNRAEHECIRSIPPGIPWADGVRACRGQ
jgi:hypothetical protein